jgi:hypothetical protein
VDVGLDEAGQDVAAARLDDTVVAFSDVRADRRDASVLDRDVTLDDVERSFIVRTVPPGSAAKDMSDLQT